MAQTFLGAPGQVASAPDSSLVTWAARYERAHIDLGTGDGKYALHLARRFPTLAVIGLDTCLDHLAGAQRRHPQNLRFVSTDARRYQAGLLPQVSNVSINFPYGCLLKALVDQDADLIDQFDRILAPGGDLVVRVNASALMAIGEPVEGFDRRVLQTLRAIPGGRVMSRPLTQAELRSVPSSWGRRLGYGKPTEAHWFGVTRLA